jgi:hypothetical protein
VSRTASNGDLSAWKRSVADAPEAAALACSVVVMMFLLNFLVG